MGAGGTRGEDVAAARMRGRVGWCAGIRWAFLSKNFIFFHCVNNLCQSGVNFSLLLLKSANLHVSTLVSVVRPTSGTVRFCAKRIKNTNSYILIERNGDLAATILMISCHSSLLLII